MDIDLEAKRLYQALIRKNKVEILLLCEKRDEGPMCVVTIHGDSVLHVALSFGHAKLAEKLLDMSHDHDLLTGANAAGNTVLHEAATNDKFIPVVKKLLELQPGLLIFMNVQKENPLFFAARYGQIKMFKFLDNLMYRQLEREFIVESVHKKGDGNTILHAAIDAEHFELAFWIAKKHEYLHNSKNYEGLTALQLLACNPLAFGFRDKARLINFFDSREVASSSSVPWWDEMLRKRRRYNAVVKLAKLLIKNDTSWKTKESGEKKDKLKKMDELKKIVAELKMPDQDELKNTEAELKKFEADLKKTDDEDELKEIEAELKKIKDQLKKLKKTGPLNTILAQLKKTDTDEQKKVEAKKKKDERYQIPLLLATQTGCFEIVEEILQVHPEAVEYVDKNGRSILHVAVKYRQMKIFDKVQKDYMAAHMRRLIQKCDSKGNSILHMVGKKIRNEDVEQTQKYSPFFQLQEDLLLFERIKGEIKPNFYKHTNIKGETAEEILALNKEALRDKSQEWLKRTADNCSIIAVLIATVAFAAAYTVPGGSNPYGSPVLLNQTFFIVFTIGDVLSLTFCLTAVVIFLSILTSSFQLQEFKLVLPQKLMLGITCLFFSVTMMMLAFSATIILMIHHNEQWSKIALYTVALLPVTVLAIVYMPLFFSLQDTFKHSLKNIISFFPRLSNSKNNDPSLSNEKSIIEADVPIDYTIAENSTTADPLV